LAKLTGKKKAAFLRRMALGRRKASTKKTKSARVKRKSSPSKNNNMAKRKKSRFTRARKVGSSISRGRSKITGVLTRGLVGKTTSALGAGIVVGALADRTVPQASVYASLGAEYLAGGVAGMVLAEGVKSFIGMPSILGQVFQSLGVGGFGSGGNAELTV